ncbi:MAG: response regulator transcription factor [Bacteroidota bacterium]|jgi:two-component system alkaline phosphatase synthesis response regulator PhoP
MDNTEIKILLVDDDADIIEFIRYNLIKEGFQVAIASNGKEAIKKAKTFIPQLIILDVMMPEMDGIEACQSLRTMKELQNTVITFLTARNEDYSQLAGFEAGADDYIQKPIKPKILISKVKSLLRRFNNTSETIENSKNLISLNSITIDKEKYTVVFNNVQHILPKKEFELLALLASKPNKVFRREEILSAIWGDDVIVGDRTIDVHIRKIREKIDLENIKTIKGVGYKFED